MSGTPQWSRMNWTSGRKIDKRDRLVDLVWQHAKIEGEAGTGKPLDVLAEQGAFRQIVGHDMEHAAKSLHQRIGFLALEKCRKAVLFRPAGSDRAGNQAAFAFGKAANVGDLRLDVGRRDVDLHVKGLGDADAMGLARIFLVAKIAVQRLRRRTARDSTAPTGRSGEDACRSTRKPPGMVRSSHGNLAFTEEWHARRRRRAATASAVVATSIFRASSMSGASGKLTSVM